MADIITAPKRKSKVRLILFIFGLVLILLSPLWLYLAMFLFVETDISVFPGGEECALYVDGRKIKHDDLGPGSFICHLLVGNRRIRITEPGYQPIDTVLNVPWGEYYIILGYELKPVSATTTQTE